MKVIGLLLVRLLFKDKEVYQILEESYSDYRKIVKRGEKDKVIHMDQIVHTLLYKTKFLGINLPPLIK